MVNSVFFFTYIFAGFVGCLAILLVILLAKHWASGNKKLLASIRNFMICTALIDALYFFMDYYFLKTGNPLTSPVARTLDIFLFIGQVTFWAAYIREKGQLSETARKPMVISTAVMCILCMTMSLCCYGFLMDDYYLTQPGLERTIALIFEVLVSILLTCITVWHLIKGLSELVQKKIRTYVVIISVFITVNGLWNAILVMRLMTGAISPLEESIMDPTALLLFIINLFTILLVYQEDFTALFRQTEAAPENNTQNRLDFIAEVHGLTQREREVLELAYEGLTNPEIADELVISKYTVKRHMHNLFEKLDISTRMELVHLVNQENGPGGSL